MLKHEVMAADEWHGNGPQDLITVSLCIEIAIKKSMCLLSVAYACPYYYSTMGHYVYNIDISKPLAHATPYMAVCHLPMKSTRL
jgi:hypothetical protein